MPRVGEPYIPFRVHRIVPIPDSLLAYPKLTLGAKVLLGLLHRYSGEDGRCYPSQATLAAELAVSERQVCKYVKALEEEGFIRVIPPSGESRLRHSNNTYEFLWHAIFEPPEQNSGSAPEQNSGSAPGLNSGSAPSKETSSKETHTLSSDRGRCEQIDEAFEIFWSLYPKRLGANPKAPAKERFRALIKNRIATAEDLLAGVKGYAAYCRSTDKVKTDLVKQAVNWLAAKNRLWEEYAEFGSGKETASEDIERRAMSLAAADGKPGAPFDDPDAWLGYLQRAREELSR